MSEISIVSVRRDHLVSALREAAETLEAEVTTRAVRHSAAARLRAMEQHVLEEAPPVAATARRLLCRGAASARPPLKWRSIARALAAGAITAEEAQVLRQAMEGNPADKASVTAALARLVRFLSPTRIRRRGRRKG